MNDEIQALRRMAQVLARVATPLERQNIARRVAQKAKGDDSELALTLAHAAALFWPGDDEKTAEVLQQITLAFDAGELGGFIPREHRHILFTDLTVWPDCPPMAADSPLRFWVPDAPAQPQAATPAPVVDIASNSTTPDPERRLARLRALGGDAIYRRGEWKITGISALVASEKSEGRKRSDEKTIRADLKEAAESEREAKRANAFSGLGQR